MDGTRKVSVYELQRARELRANVLVLDVSSARARKKLGVIPGAQLATSTLPANRNTPIVYYCESERCRAASKAARAAIDAGYTNVRVLEGGARAWRSAGHRLAKR